MNKVTEVTEATTFSNKDNIWILNQIVENFQKSGSFGNCGNFTPEVIQ